ncbi:MAG: ATP-binding protein, partial [Natronospirillum sp.]
QVNERRQFSRELHDGINQQLVSLKLRIELAEKKMAHADTQLSALSDLDLASNILNSTIQEVRQISHNLRPVMLDDLGLRPALRGLIEQFAEHTGIAVELYYNLDEVEVSDDIETTIYRITQECLQNIEKHARAQRVEIRVQYANDRIQFEVTDNGCGFNASISQHQGIGLINMKERVEVIGGTLDLESNPGHGSTISAILPCKQRWRHSA